MSAFLLRLSYYSLSKQTEGGDRQSTSKPAGWNLHYSKMLKKILFFLLLNYYKILIFVVLVKAISPRNYKRGEYIIA